MSSYTVHTIGKIACELISQEVNHVPVEVLGISSQSCYLGLSSGRVIVLTSGNTRGPLTLNMSGEPGWINQVHQGDKTRITPDGMLWLGDDLQVDIHQAVRWEAPPRPGDERVFQVISTPKFQDRFMVVACQVLHQKGIASSSPERILLDLLTVGQTRIGERNQAILSRTIGLQSVLHHKRFTEIVLACESLYGIGSGLTPQGDDLLLGLLLALNRWGDVLKPDLDVIMLTRVILERVHAKTTALSASLIECATQGQADECLVYGLDGLVAGVNEESGANESNHLANIFTGWGNSSGAAVLAGIGILAG